MAGLQRSAVSFRRQGSSGIVWDDRFLSEELNQVNQEQQSEETKQLQRDSNNPEKIDVVKDVKRTTTIERSRSSGERRGFRAGKVSPATEPPSPKVSACGFCGAFGKQAKDNQRKNPVKIRSR